MWFYIFLAVVAIFFVVWITRTNLFRHWRRQAAGPGQEGTNRSGIGNYTGNLFDDGRGEG